MTFVPVFSITVALILLTSSAVIFTACFIGYCYHRYKLRRALRQAIKAKEVKCNYPNSGCSTLARNFFIVKPNRDAYVAYNLCQDHRTIAKLVSRSNALTLRIDSEYPTIEERDLALVKKRL